MATGRSNKVVGQIGEFLACAEVARHCDCVTTPFAGNVPVFDILATDDQCRTVPMQIKTANGGTWQFDATKFLRIDLDEDSKRQSVVGLRSLIHPDLIYVFVWLGHTKHKSDRFFLCLQSELQHVIHDAYTAWLDQHGGQRPRKWDSTHCSISTSNLDDRFKDRWDLVTSQLVDNTPTV